MPVIRVSETVDKFIRSKGHFGDSHDSILCRLLGLKAGAAGPPLSVHHRRLILQILLNTRGHKMIASKVLARLDRQIKAVPLKTPRAQRIQKHSSDLAQAARRSLSLDGMLHRVRREGHVLWKLTDKGIQRAKQLRPAAAHNPPKPKATTPRKTAGRGLSKMAAQPKYLPLKQKMVQPKVVAK